MIEKTGEDLNIYGWDSHDVQLAFGFISDNDTDCFFVLIINIYAALNGWIVWLSPHFVSSYDDWDTFQVENSASPPKQGRTHWLCGCVKALWVERIDCFGYMTSNWNILAKPICDFTKWIVPYQRVISFYCAQIEFKFD